MKFIENESAQKLRGGYYTPPDLAGFLARWVLAGRPQRILEPSVGDGAFLAALAQMRPAGLKSIVACELDTKEAAKARRRARDLSGVDTTVHAGDFLRWSLDRLREPPAFDGVLGNPPFIRYQYLDKTIQSRAEDIFAHFGLPFTKHTNAWVPFVIASIAQLKPGGRLGMVVPAELLHVLHAQSLRQFLLKHCARVVVVDPQELWFSDILQGVMLLFAEKGVAPANGRVAIVPVKDRQFLKDDPADLFAEGDFLSGRRLPLKWMPALLTPRERSLLDGLRSLGSVRIFSDVASVDVGIVTGANKFFLVPRSVVEEYGLSQWAHPMFGRSEHVRGVIFDERSYDENTEAGLPSNFLWFGDRELSSFPPSVQRYILQGEQQGLHRRYKCRIRTPWYNVPSVFPASVGMLKRSHDFPRLALNRHKVLTTDTAYRIEPNGVSASRLVYSFVNSLTALTTELEGRHYGGGVLELVPSELSRVLVPLAQVTPAKLERLDKTFRAGTDARQVLSDQDTQILEPLGLTKRDTETLYGAWLRLRNRRQRNGHEADAARLGDVDDVGAAILGRAVDR